MHEVTLSNIQVSYNIYMADCFNSHLFYNDAIQAHSLSSWDFLADSDMSPKGQYSNYKPVCIQKNTRTQVLSFFVFFLQFLTAAISPLCYQSFYLTTASCMAKGSSTPTHTYTFTGVNTSISLSLQPQTPLLFDLSHPSPCLIPISPLASTKWNANSPA